MPTPKIKLDRQQAAILLVDVQDRLTPAMPPEALARVVKYGKALIAAGKELGLPVLATEQYPKVRKASIFYPGCETATLRETRVFRIPARTLSVRF